MTSPRSHQRAAPADRQPAVRPLPCSFFFLNWSRSPNDRRYALPSSISFGDGHQLLRRSLFKAARTRLMLRRPTPTATLLLATATPTPWWRRCPFLRRTFRSLLPRSLLPFCWPSLPRPLLLRLLGLSFVLPTPAPATRLRRRRSLGARSNHRQRHASPLRINRRYPHPHLIAHRNHLMRIAHVTGAKLADMNQPTIRKPHVDERAEIDHVQHRTAKFHARQQVFELHHVLTENRRRQIFARVATRPAQRFDHVVECELPHAKFRRKRLPIKRRHSFANLSRTRAARQPSPGRCPASPAASSPLRSFQDESKSHQAADRRPQSSRTRPPERTSRYRAR